MFFKSIAKALSFSKISVVKSTFLIANVDPSKLKIRFASLKIQTISSQAWYAITADILSIVSLVSINCVKVELFSK